MKWFVFGKLIFYILKYVSYYISPPLLGPPRERKKGGRITNRKRENVKTVGYKNVKCDCSESYNIISPSFSSSVFF